VPQESRANSCFQVDNHCFQEETSGTFVVEMPVSTKPEGTLASRDHLSARDFDFLREADDVFQKQISKLSLRHHATTTQSKALWKRCPRCPLTTATPPKLDPISVYFFSAVGIRTTGAFKHFQQLDGSI
jgi:hypothetical protein